MATLTPLPLLVALGYYRARASYCPLASAEEKAGKETSNQLVLERQEVKGEKEVVKKEVTA